MKKTIRNKELLVGVIFLIVGVAYFALAFTIPSYDAYGGSSVVDSSFVPKVIGALMTVLSVLQLVFSLGPAKTRPLQLPLRSRQRKTARSRWRTGTMTLPTATPTPRH